MFVLKLPRFFTRLFGEGKKAAISKLTYIWTPSSRSYIVFALNILTNFENVNQVIRSISTSLKMRIFLSFNFSLCPSSNVNKRAPNQQLLRALFFGKPRSQNAIHTLLPQAPKMKQKISMTHFSILVHISRMKEMHCDC